jgi:hypothetical protein
LLLSLFSISISSGLKEKKATSEPEIRADPMSSISRIAIPMIIPGSGVFTSIPERSVINESGYSGSKVVSD